MGVTVDPSYAFPLPIFGINYLDFKFGGPNSQLALLFAGVLAAGNIQRPKLGRTPLDASVDFFAHRRAVERSRLQPGRRANSRAPADLAAVDRTQPRLAVHAVSEGDRCSISSASTATSGTRTTSDDFDVPVEHRHQRHRRRVGVPPRRLQPAAERHVVPPRDVAGLGTSRRSRTARGQRQPARLCQIQRQPVARLLFQGVSQDPSERRLVRRPAISIVSRSISSGCSTTPVFTACPAPACGSIELAMAAAPIR